MRNEFMPGDLPPQYGPVFQDTSRQMKLADLLRQQSLEMPEGQMVSGIYVPPAITQYMAQALKGYNANKMEADAQSKQKAAYDDFQAKRTNATQALIDGLKTKTVDQPVDYSDAGGMPGMTEQVQQQPDFNAAFTSYLNSGVADPAMVAYVTGERNYQRGREDKLEDRQENRAAQAQAIQEQREARMQELQLRLQDAATSRAEQAALRKELIQMQNDARRDMMVLSAANRPAPAASPVTVMRDGKPTIVDARTGRMIGEAPASSVSEKAPPGYRFKADGTMEAIPGGPADQKAQQQSAGKETVDAVVSSLRDAYTQLDENSGITSTDAGALGNAGRYISQSGVGQFAGSVTGTKNQELRDKIAQQRPLLLQAIMKATGMSAKQMDSNAELKLYLATATDPTKSLQANRQALDMIEKLYGSGAGNPSITGNNIMDKNEPMPEVKPKKVKFGDLP